MRVHTLKETRLGGPRLKFQIEIIWRWAVVNIEHVISGSIMGRQRSKNRRLGTEDEINTSPRLCWAHWTIVSSHFPPFFSDRKIPNYRCILWSDDSADWYGIRDFSQLAILGASVIVYLMLPCLLLISFRLPFRTCIFKASRPRPLSRLTVNPLWKTVRTAGDTVHQAKHPENTLQKQGSHACSP